MITFGRTAILPTFAPPSKTMQPAAPAVMPQRLPQSRSVYDQPQRYTSPSDAATSTPTIRRATTSTAKPAPSSPSLSPLVPGFRDQGARTTTDKPAPVYTDDASSYTSEYQSSYTDSQAYTPEVVGSSDIPEAQTPGGVANQELTKEEKAAAQAPAPFKMPTWGWVAGGLVLVAGIAFVASK